MGCFNWWALVHKLMDNTLPWWVLLLSFTSDALTQMGISFTNPMRYIDGVGNFII
jgi:hypothetical protein